MSLKRVPIETVIKYMNDLARGGGRGVMGQIGREMETSVKKRIAGGQFKKNKPLTIKNRRGKKGLPLNNTGRLRSSITNTTIGRDAVAIGSPLVYAPMMNDGKTITPTKAKKLAIPMGKKVARMAETMSVRKVLATFEKAGYNIFFDTNAILGYLNKKTTVLFIRKDSVTIPKREYLFIDDNDEKLIAAIYEKWAFAL